MTEGDILLVNLPQADGNVKLRPVLLLKHLPGHNDSLVCGISTQLHQLVKDFNELLDENSDHFIQTGLRQSSIVRLGFLAVMPNHKIPGRIGKIESSIHRNLLERLAKCPLK